MTLYGEALKLRRLRDQTIPDLQAQLQVGIYNLLIEASHEFGKGDRLAAWALLNLDISRAHFYRIMAQGSLVVDMPYSRKKEIDYKSVAAMEGKAIEVAAHFNISLSSVYKMRAKAKKATK